MQMGRKRRTFTDKFKAKVALEAIRGVKTINELAKEYRSIRIRSRVGSDRS